MDAVVPEVVYYQVEPSLGHEVNEAREHLEGLISIAEHDHVVADQIVGLENVAVVRQNLQLRFSRLAIVQAKVVAGLEVYCDGTVGVGLQINCEDFKTHVIVVELVVTHSNVHVEGKIVPVL